MAARKPNFPDSKEMRPRPAARSVPVKHSIGPFGVLVRIAAVLLLGWIGGFVWFSQTLPGPAPLALKTDAVVVLTGGAGRLQRGLQVLEARAARRMLVSGVGRDTTRRQLALAAGIAKKRLDTTDLGYEAVDTRSNAEETARWVAKNDFRIIRLVTSSGHMRRSMLELTRVLPPAVEVVPDGVPVPPQLSSIASEYSKYLLRRVALASGAA
ncbi:YdcF family protein [Sandarakinorhabdus sp.]|uniref:YdcF family protein n=1 Tax=Sandarakinorhabdus sp. TaxID=1916663 RepID=UPI00286E77F0|nr:YdcF family protein [Sandarakinorhabdus sp.]